MSKIVGPLNTTGRPEFSLGVLDRMNMFWPLTFLGSPSAFTMGTLEAYVAQLARCASVSTDDHCVAMSFIDCRTACCRAVFGFVGLPRPRTYMPPLLWAYVDPLIEPETWAKMGDLNFTLWPFQRWACPPFRMDCSEQSRREDEALRLGERTRREYQRQEPRGIKSGYCGVVFPPPVLGPRAEVLAYAYHGDVHFPTTRAGGCWPNDLEA